MPSEQCYCEDGRDSKCDFCTGVREPPATSDTQHTVGLLVADSTLLKIVGRQTILVAAAEFADVSVEEAKANAEFIALSWNAHDELLARLTVAADWLADKGVSADHIEMVRIRDAISGAPPKPAPAGPYMGVVNGLPPGERGLED